MGPSGSQKSEGHGATGGDVVLPVLKTRRRECRPILLHRSCLYFSSMTSRMKITVIIMMYINISTSRVLIKNDGVREKKRYSEVPGFGPNGGWSRLLYR